MNNQYEWYTALVKPAWAPPEWLFGPAWSVLYIIIALTFGFVFYQVFKGALPKKVAIPFILNLVFNLLFTPIQFGLQNNTLAAVDILLVLATLVWAMKSVWAHYRWIAYANIPYLLWVSFATILQLTITVLNF